MNAIAILHGGIGIMHAHTHMHTYVFEMVLTTIKICQKLPCAGAAEETFDKSGYISTVPNQRYILN